MAWQSDPAVEHPTGAVRPDSVSTYRTMSPGTLDVGANCGCSEGVEGLFLSSGVMPIAVYAYLMHPRDPEGARRARMWSKLFRVEHLSGCIAS